MIPKRVTWSIWGAATIRTIMASLHRLRLLLHWNDLPIIPKCFILIQKYRGKQQWYHLPVIHVGRCTLLNYTSIKGAAYIKNNWGLLVKRPSHYHCFPASEIFIHLHIIHCPVIYLEHHLLCSVWLGLLGKKGMDGGAIKPFWKNGSWSIVSILFMLSSSSWLQLMVPQSQISGWPAAAAIPVVW